ncbi:MAG: PQQ-binding-like beta-propeller repeat protein, partial [Planctomycetaceae bacterium]|nr:PQQ-binding-like beta-propeller repeat protein [Planctomycetaceae bacterium]
MTSAEELHHEGNHAGADDVPTNEASAPLSTRPPRRAWEITFLLVLLAALWGGYTFALLKVEESLSAFFLGRLIIPAVSLIVLLLWWAFLAPLSRRLRWIVLGLFAITLVATVLSLHPSLNVMSLLMFGAPACVTLWSGWLLLIPPQKPQLRVRGVILLNGLTGLVFCLLRVHGLTGDFSAEWDWRWNLSPEEQLIASGVEYPLPDGSASSDTGTLTLQPGDWPEFRGPNRDGVLRGVTIETDWQTHPPKEVWRTTVGPGWSSFCIVDGHVFTQEQLGNQELTVCRDAVTGDTKWVHADQTRFEEAIAGAGPRATPTFHNGQLFVQGANGLLSCLNAANGEVIWQQDVTKLTGATIPIWGFAASPLVHGDDASGKKVTVFGGQDGKAVLTLSAATGEQLWTAGKGTFSYCSAQLSTVSDVPQLLFSTDFGLTSLEPNNGQILWEHEWQINDIARIVQPCVLSGDDILIGTGLGPGTRRIHVEHAGDDWRTTEVW